MRRAVSARKTDLPPLGAVALEFVADARRANPVHVTKREEKLDWAVATGRIAAGRRHVWAAKFDSDPIGTGFELDQLAGSKAAWFPQFERHNRVAS